MERTETDPAVCGNDCQVTPVFEFLERGEGREGK